LNSLHEDSSAARSVGMTAGFHDATERINGVIAHALTRGIKGIDWLYRHHPDNPQPDTVHDGELTERFRDDLGYIAVIVGVSGYEAVVGGAAKISKGVETMTHKVLELFGEDQGESS
jgi:hypothetical protein